MSAEYIIKRLRREIEDQTTGGMHVGLPRVKVHVSDLEYALKTLEALQAACQDFVSKVDDGRARSVDSYAKMLAALGLPQPTPPPQHVCGLTGYNPMIDPRCPGCEARGF